MDFEESNSGSDDTYIQSESLQEAVNEDSAPVINSVNLLVKQTVIPV